MRKLILLAMVLSLAMISPAFAKAKKKKGSEDEPLITEVTAVSITISIGKSGGDHQTFKVANTTKVTLDGHAASIDDLKAGMQAKIEGGESDVSGTTAKSIDAKDPPKH